MVVKHFVPKNTYLNGIVKSIFKTNKTDDIVVGYKSILLISGNVYPSAILEDGDSYYQSTEIDSYIELNIAASKISKSFLWSVFNLKSSPAYASAAASTSTVC